jgi:hypothetical protein
MTMTPGFAFKSHLERFGTETCRRHVMFIETARFCFSSPAKSEMTGISLIPELLVGNPVAINISPLCGDELVEIGLENDF